MTKNTNNINDKSYCTFFYPQIGEMSSRARLLTVSECFGHQKKGLALNYKLLSEKVERKNHLLKEKKGAREFRPNPVARILSEHVNDI